jgi:hypothetical protein
VKEYQHDDHTYQLSKFGLADGKEVWSKLLDIGYFDDGLKALMKSTSELDSLERKLFGANVQLLNEQGDWVPMGKGITEAHFAGRLAAYMTVIVAAINYNFEDFLEDGSSTGLAPEVGAE